MDIIQNALTAILNFFNGLIPNYGVAIILLTIVLKLILYWPQQQSLRSTLKMQAMQPEMQEIQKKFKSDPDQLNKAMSQLYKKHGINPVGCFTSSCLLQIPQLLIMWALWFALQAFFTTVIQVPIDTALGYGLQFTSTTPTNPVAIYSSYTTITGTVGTSALLVRGATPEAWFFGFNLAYLPNQGPWWYYLWPVLVAGTMFLQSKTMGSSQQQGGMLISILFPLLIGWISLSIPVAVSLYWVVFSLLQVAQQLITFKGLPKKPQSLQPATVTVKPITGNKPIKANKEKRK